MRRYLEPDEWADVRSDIFALYRQLGITTEDERHHVQYAVTGCGSLRYMTREEHFELIKILNDLPIKPSPTQRRAIRGLLTLSSFTYHPTPQGE